MKSFLLFSMAFYCVVPGYSQNAAIDSFTRLISKAQSDTGRINLINKRNFLISRINIDSAMNIGKKTVEEAKAINYSYGEATARLGLAANYCMKGVFRQAEENLDISVKLFTTLDDSLGLSHAYSGYGMMLGMQSKYDSSILYYEKAIAVAERNNFTTDLPTYYGNIAIGHQMKSNFSAALTYQQKSLELSRATNDISDQAYTSLNMGLTYINIGDTARGEQYLLESVKLAKSKDIRSVELYAYSNLADLNTKKGEMEKAYQFAMQAASLGQQMGDQGIRAASLAKAAEAQANLNNLAEAEALAKQAIEVADSSGQTYNIYQAYSAMGKILKEKEDYHAAITFLNKSIAALTNTDLYNEGVGSTYSILSLCYERTGNFANALLFYKTSAEISDSVLNRDNIRKATELSMNYEFDKKQEAQRIEQKNKDAIARSKQWALIIGLGFTLILAIVAFRAYRNKQKANSRLQQQKEEIQNTLSKLESTQAQLIQSEKMASLGVLTAGIAHEIQNPLNFVNNFSEVNGELLDELQQAIDKGNTEDVRAIAGNFKENLELINHHGKRADAIVKGMLQHSRTSSGQKELTDINALADEYLRLAYHGLRAKDKSFNVKLETNFDTSIGKINIIPQDIGRVLLNLVNNAFYAVNERKKSGIENYEPAVSLSTIKINGKSDSYLVEIKVKDNGNGISEKIVDKIFQPFFTTKPTGQGTGLGLSLAYDIIKAHGGEIKVETRSEGSEFIIHLPYILS